MPVPVIRWDKFSYWPGNQPVRLRTGVGPHTAAIALNFNLEMPIERTLCRAMMIAIQAKWEEAQIQCYLVQLILGQIMHHILHVGSILSIFHPDTLFQVKIILKCITKAGYVALQRKAFKVVVSLWVNRAILIFINT